MMALSARDREPNDSRRSGAPDRAGVLTQSPVTGPTARRPVVLLLPVVGSSLPSGLSVPTALGLNLGMGD